MAEESKKDELVVMRLIAEGKTQVKDLADSLGWSPERVEATVEDLKRHEYVESAQTGGDQVLAITERGREHLPQLIGEVMGETREYLDAVSETFRRHMDKVFPKVSLDIDIEEPDTGTEHACNKCGKAFESERGLKVHQGMEH
ncbi:MAG: hypothetical protein MUP63_04010 [Candidatus Nanohaloarchaeota archaeon QJJ-7]|nr:hypothetical protein [Candidatus Nanohaloarchaeota archaeon QJJ-7]